MSMAETPTRGYTATKDQLLARLRRIEGQIRGIEGRLTRRGCPRAVGAVPRRHDPRARRKRARIRRAPAFAARNWTE